MVGRGRFGGLGGISVEGNDAAETSEAEEEAEEEKLSKPCFEAYWKGAWLEVTIKQSRSERYLIRYAHRPDLGEAWISLDVLRPRARRCDDWDCGILKVGVDVSVYGEHPQAYGLLKTSVDASVFGRHPQAHRTTALYDAKIVSVAKAKHNPDCCCSFTVQYFNIKTTTDFVYQRRLLPREYAVVGTSTFRVLQQPGVVPLHAVIKDHIARKWSPERNRWYLDAYFLKETRLRLFRDPKMDDYETAPEGDTQQEDGISDEDLEVPDTTDTMNAHQSGEGVAPKSPVQERKTQPESKNATSPQFHSREETQVGHQQGKQGMEYPEQGVKRKYDSADEKETSNLVQEEDYYNSGTPGESSPFTRSQEKMASSSRPRRRGQNSRQGRPSIRDIGDDPKVGKGVNLKRGQKLKLSDSESSSPDDSSKSQEGIADGGHSSERRSDRDHRRPKKGHLARKEHLHGQSKAEQMFQGRPSGNTKPGKSLEKKEGRLRVEETEQKRPSSQKPEKGVWPRDDPKLRKSDQKQIGRKRGRPKIPSGMSSSSGGSEEMHNDNLRTMNDSPGRARQSLDTYPENSGSPAANLDTRGSQGTETDSERSKRESRGNQGSKLRERRATRRSSDRLKVSPAMRRSIARKEQVKKAHKKSGNDSGSEKSDADCSTPSPNSEDLASGPGPRLRKLRPSRSSRPTNKYQTRNQSNTLSKSNKKDAEFRENGPAEKVVDRPLYMDLLLDNCKDGDDGENAPCPVKEQKPSTGLLDTWDPNPEDSETDLNKVTEEDTLAEKMWQDCYLAEHPLVVEPNPLIGAGQDDACDDGIVEAKVSNSDSTQCKHFLEFDDSKGLVCDLCGLVTVTIEELVPEVACTHPRTREAELDDWDFGRKSPDINQGATYYDQVKNMNGEVVTMLDTCLPPHYAKQMHPHQKDGFEFLWRNLAHHEQGKLKSSKSHKNAGCILSHAPGTGKSFLIIAFLKSYMDKFPSCRPLIVAPKIMLLRWEKEFARWKSDIKVFILNLATVNGRRLVQKHEQSGDISRSRQMNPRVALDTCRCATLHEWRKRRSVCLVSYSLFSTLTTDEEGTNRTPEGELVKKSLLESPGVLILDEGHFPRNKDTRIRKVLMKVQTNARILLSGTLFQNNFEELFNTFYLVRPGFVKAFSSCKQGVNSMLVNELKEEPADDHLGMEEVTEAAEKRARKLFVEEIGMKIEEGQLCKGSKVLQKGLLGLQRLTTNFVHHHTGEVLSILPGLRDFAILLKPTGLQCTLLALVDQRFQDYDEYLKREVAVSAGSIHPNLLTKLEFVKSDILNCLRGKVPQSDIQAMWKEPTDPEDGVKTKFVFDLLCSLKSSNEKVLIFSQHISPLDMLEAMFKAAFNWDKNKDVLRLDGGTKDREAIIERFNEDQSQAQVLLASTKACGEGINLVGASRVVFLDVLWNPAVIQQAISRAFRLGQKKTVFVYRLIALGTIEEKKYKKAIRKDWLSKSIFCPAEGAGHVSSDQPEDTSCLKNLSPPEEILAWEVDATTCEDDILEKLLNSDKSQANSYLKVVEHSSQFHNRKTSCGPDARDWFLDDWEYNDLSHVKGTREDEELGLDSTNPENLASKLYQDFGEIGALDVGADSSSDRDTDEEDF